jgi:probable addiction module antidote protein
MGKKAAVDYKTSTLYPMLRDDLDFAVAYLNECFEDDDPRLFLLALRHVIEARAIPKTELASKAGLDRTAIYNALSDKGNPNLKTFTGILGALGLRITIKKQRKASNRKATLA